MKARVKQCIQLSKAFTLLFSVTPADNRPDSNAYASNKMALNTETKQISCRKREILF